MDWPDAVALGVTVIGSLLIGVALMLMVLRPHLRRPSGGAAITGVGCVTSVWSQLTSGQMNVTLTAVGTVLIVAGVATAVSVARDSSGRTGSGG